MKLLIALMAILLIAADSFAGPVVVQTRSGLFGRTTVVVGNGFNNGFHNGFHNGIGFHNGFHNLNGVPIQVPVPVYVQPPTFGLPVPGCPTQQFQQLRGY